MSSAGDRRKQRNDRCTVSPSQKQNSIGRCDKTVLIAMHAAAQQPQANNASGQRVPGPLDDGEAIILQAHAPHALELMS
jgi:hypothetical protein